MTELKIFPEFFKFPISKKEAERVNETSVGKDIAETELKKRDLIVKEKSSDDLKKATDAGKSNNSNKT